jgi:hypothetical protein
MRAMTGSRGLELFAAHDPQVERIWRALEASALRSCFLSWGFIKN